jgi:hypothetical protein
MKRDRIDLLDWRVLWDLKRMEKESSRASMTCITARDHPKRVKYNLTPNFWEKVYVKLTILLLDGLG